MKLFALSSQVGAGSSFSPDDYMVLPEHKRVFVDMIYLGLASGTSGSADIYMIEGTLEIPLIESYPLDSSDRSIVLFPQIHLEAGQGIRFRISNLGAADLAECAVIGVK